MQLMTELAQPFPYEYLRDKYKESSPGNWAERFTNAILTEETDTPDGPEDVPSSDFSFYLFQETVDLVHDMGLSTSTMDEEDTMESLIDRERVDPWDEIDFFSVSEQEYSEIVSSIVDAASRKLKALSDYLTFKGHIQAVPLAFLTGRIDGIFTDRFASFDGPWSAHAPLRSKFFTLQTGDVERGKVIRKAQKLHQNGGRIIFPDAGPEGVLNIFTQPGDRAKFARIAFGSIPQHFESKLIVSSNISDERQVLAMLHPNELATND